MYWLPNISEAIINSVWQSAFAYCLLFVIRKSPFSSPKFTYILGIAFQYFLVFLFINDVFSNNNSLLNYTVDISNDYLKSNILNIYISNTYIILLIINIGYLCIQNFRSKHITNFVTTQSSAEVRLIISDWKNRLKINRSISIIISENITTPFTKGVLKPVILLPLSFINGLEVKQMEAILLHEIWHIKRYDYLFLWIQVILGKIMFFNPFFRIIDKAINEDRELSCDINTINVSKTKPIDYIDSLLFFTESKNGNLINQPSLSIAGQHTGELMNRATYLLENKKNTKFKGKLWMNILAVICVMISSIHIQKNTSIVHIVNPKFTNIGNVASLNIEQNKKFTIKPIKIISEKNNFSEKTNNQLVAKNDDKKININKTVKLSNYLSKVSKNSDEDLAKNKEIKEENPIVQMVAYMEAGENNRKNLYKKVYQQSDKVGFILENKNNSELSDTYEKTLHWLTNRFEITGSSCQYATYVRDNDVREIQTTYLYSNNYKIKLIKNDSSILMIIGFNSSPSAMMN